MLYISPLFIVVYRNWTTLSGGVFFEFDYTILRTCLPVCEPAFIFWNNSSIFSITTLPTLPEVPVTRI